MIVGKTVQEIFGSLPDEAVLQAQAVATTALKTNVHVHLPPNFGSIESVEGAIQKAKAEEIAVLGTSNYYDYTIYTTFAHAAVKAGIVPVFGIEVLTMDEDLRTRGILVNDPKNPGKVYMCGKGLTCFDQIPAEIVPIWTHIRENDKQRIEAMIAKVNAISWLQRRDIQLQYKTIAQTLAEAKSVPVATVFLQERHVVQALQQLIFARVAATERPVFFQELYHTSDAVETKDRVKIQDDLRNALLKQGRAAYVDECFVNPAEAAELIIGLGGYVSYPTLIDGAPQILPGEGTPEELVQKLFAQQIGAAEFIPTRNDHAVLTKYVTTLRQQGIVVGAGTEHNAADWIPLLPACKKGVPLGDELTQIFWEGACVAVAHQYLRAKGQPGFQFLPEQSARETQIQRMAKVGAQVVACFRK